MKITIGHLYPDMLNLYGDSGNVATLTRRLIARGIDVGIKKYSINDEVDFSALDIVYIGGGGDRENFSVCESLKKQRDNLVAYAEDGGVILAACGGFEILGKYYKTADDTVEGVGLLDICTEYDEHKLIGNVVVESELLGATVVGFENHNGRVDIGGYTPLGKNLAGFGHDGKGTEGLVYKNVIATYLHGPLLPKNPVLADYIIKKAVEKQLGETVELPEIDDTLENAAHDYIIGRFINK